VKDLKGAGAVWRLSLDVAKATNTVVQCHNGALHKVKENRHVSGETCKLQDEQRKEQEICKKEAPSESEI
jgi:hypothetical protein